MNSITAATVILYRVTIVSIIPLLLRTVTDKLNCISNQTGQINCTPVNLKTLLIWKRISGPNFTKMSNVMKNFPRLNYKKQIQSSFDTSTVRCTLAVIKLSKADSQILHHKMMFNTGHTRFRNNISPHQTSEHLQPSP